MAKAEEVNGRPKVMKVVYEDHYWGLAVLSPLAMRGLLTISRWDELDPASPDGKGYQRNTLEGGKINKIVKYLIHDLKIDDGWIERPTALTVAVRIKPKQIDEFIELFNQGDVQALKKRFGDRCLSIIDGQHRDFGIIEATKKEPSYNPMTPVVLFWRIDFEEEAEQFDIINSEQSKLPKSLVQYNKLRITERTALDHDQLIRIISGHLMEDSDSPFVKIGVNRSGAREPGKHITFEGLRRSTGNMLTPLLVKRIQARGKDPLDFAKTYWNLVTGTCAKYWIAPPPKEKRSKKDEEKPEEPRMESRLVELVGIAAISQLGFKVIESALEHTVPIDRMKELVGRLADVDFEKRHDNHWVSTQAGFAGMKDMYTMLYNHVYELDEAA
jgi:DGQHR domain-containing protein